MQRLRISFVSMALFCLLLSLVSSIKAQDLKPILQQYLEKNKDKWELSGADIADWSVTDHYTDNKTGITHAYLHQQFSGIRIFNAVSAVAIRNAGVVVFSNRFNSNITGKVNTTKASISPDDAIFSAAAHHGLEVSGIPVMQVYNETANRWTYNECGIAKQPIQIELVYQAAGNRLLLAYDVNIAVSGSHDWWNTRVDALSGEILAENNWTVSCDFPVTTSNKNRISATDHANEPSLPLSSAPPSTPPGGGFRVFPLPLEAPTFGSRALLTNPHDTVASPYGWLDNDGLTGAEFTITRGNNVFAYTDTLGNDLPQFSPDGGTLLDFDFPLDLSQQPTFSKSAIVTNLFYVNNRVHDVLYHHGFDAAAGSFQDNNYGNGGLGQDYVLAEAQDGGGTNNANFSTPPDGLNGIMQMYLWSSTAVANLTVNTPVTIAGVYDGSGMSSFGPLPAVAITNDLVLVNDNTVPFTDACNPIQNGAAINGKIALIDRGSCTFVSKVQAAEALGAIAVIVINNVAGAPMTMGGTGTVGIPSLMISLDDGNLIKNILSGGETVNVTIPAMAETVSIDGSLDNGIVTHEYGHGVSNRLTGGPSNASCLSNPENGSEGWSDWLALILTIENGDSCIDPRPVGTYALAESPAGGGIRVYPYSTDMAINPHTYASIALNPEIHAIGEIWSAVLWDMTWNLINAEGLSDNWVSDTGGNIVALKLVLEAMKLQPCDPGFLDSRDAILMADSLLYNGAHTCLIWKSFAGRGMGTNASQGDPYVVGDETENFDTPTLCTVATTAPQADFMVNMPANCSGIFAFTDLSFNTPQTWAWDFGDGTSVSNIKNPSHSFLTPGPYTVTLVVTNTVGSDTAYTTVLYYVVEAPQASQDTAVCHGHSAVLNSTVSGNNLIDWMNGTTIVHTGSSFVTPPITASTTYTVREYEPFIDGFVGPVDNTFGPGGYHTSTFEGKQKFESYLPMRLVSCWVDASGTANRTINLYDQSGNTLLQAITVNVPDGQSNIVLNMDIPVAGTYWIGVTAPTNLYRNNGGASYPYTLSNLASIITSNATSTPTDFYYYLYNWHVEEMHCESAPDTVTVSVIPAPAGDFSFGANQLSYTFTDLSTGNPTYWEWIFGDGAMSNLQNPEHVYAQSGTYTVTLFVSNGICSDTISKVIDVVTGLGELNSPTFITLSPVPASDIVTVSFGRPLEGKVQVDILTVDGQKIRSNVFYNPADQLRLPLNRLAEGIYFLRVENKGSVIVKKMSVVR